MYLVSGYRYLGTAVLEYSCFIKSEVNFRKFESDGSKVTGIAVYTNLTGPGVHHDFRVCTRRVAHREVPAKT